MNSVDGAASIPSLAQQVNDIQIRGVQIAVGANIAAVVDGVCPGPRHLGDYEFPSGNEYLKVSRSFGRFVGSVRSVFSVRCVRSVFVFSVVSPFVSYHVLRAYVRVGGSFHSVFRCFVVSVGRPRFPRDYPWSLWRFVSFWPFRISGCAQRWPDLRATFGVSVRPGC